MTARRFDPRKIDWSLYAILDREFAGDRSFGELAEAVIRGGAGVIQLRDKVSEGREFYFEALAVRNITRNYGVPFIVNDRVDVALAVDADGVHVGWNDLPPDVTRRLIGEERLLGLSASSDEEVARALEFSPDYLGVGAMFTTSTKPDYEVPGPALIARVRGSVPCPVVGIGGITPENAGQVIRAGADGVAVISALLTAEDVEARARQFVEAVRRAQEAS